MKKFLAAFISLFFAFVSFADNLVEKPSQVSRNDGSVVVQKAKRGKHKAAKKKAARSQKKRRALPVEQAPAAAEVTPSSH